MRELLGRLVDNLLGIIILLLGLALLLGDASTPPLHIIHILVFLGIAIFGAGLMRPQTVTPMLQQVTTILSSILPKTWIVAIIDFLSTKIFTHDKKS